MRARKLGPVSHAAARTSTTLTRVKRVWRDVRVMDLVVGGTAATLSGQGVMNKTGFATNFIYYGLPGNKQVGLSGGGMVPSHTGFTRSLDFTRTLNAVGNGDKQRVLAALGGPGCITVPIRAAKVEIPEVGESTPRALSHRPGASQLTGVVPDAGSSRALHDLPPARTDRLRRRRRWFIRIPPKEDEHG